jgi:hypothetical protein
MKKILSLLAFAAMVTMFVACDDEKTTPDGPAITTPTSVTDVQVGTDTDVTFDITIPGGFKSYDVSATGGTAVKKSEPAAGDKEGHIAVTYTADATAGAGTVSITVTDKNDKTDAETAAVNKTAAPVIPIIVVSGVLDADQTWSANNIYEIAGRVIVKNGVTLTINAGTVVKGREGTGINASVLMVARGGKLNANGTAAAPIIMTSVLDDIKPGMSAGTTLDEDDRGKWGGLVILGKAPISVSGNAVEAQIEGVPASETLGLYGGADAADNSGTITYLSIRHGGSVIAEGNEINGLTLGGVGSGTTISNIEVFANVDDGAEFFGGTVNVSNILVAYHGDDGLDIDQAYKGTIDGFYVIHGGDTDEGLEIDGPEGTVNTTDRFVIKNGTLVGDPSKTGDVSSIGDFKSKAQGTVENVLITGYTAGKKIKIAASYATACAPGSTNAFSNLVGDLLTFSDVQFTGFVVDVYSANVDNCAEANVPPADQTAAEGKIVSTSVGAGIPATSTWSWTLSSERSFVH